LKSVVENITEKPQGKKRNEYLGWEDHLSFKLLSFADALKASEQYGKRHLILGNGFSIACKPDIFAYGSLFEEAKKTMSKELAALFAAMGTQDFEVACTRFRRHRVRCFNGTGGWSWRDGSSRESSSLRLCA
jgi:hypothetical protein